MSVPQDGSPTLQDFVTDVSDPNSPNYRHYIDVPTFASRYGSPNTGVIGAWASTHGLTVAQTFPNNLMVSVRGTAASIEQALYVDLNYCLRPDGTQFYGPDRQPSLDTTAPVLHIGNLDNLFVSKPADNGSGYYFYPYTTKDYNGPCGATNLYAGDDFRNAYAFDPSLGTHTTLTGAGECVGLMGGDGISLYDQQLYWHYSGRDALPMPVIKAVNASNEPMLTPCHYSAPNCKASDLVNKGQLVKCGSAAGNTAIDGQNHCRATLPPDMSCCNVDYKLSDPNAGLAECYNACLPNVGCDANHMGLTTGVPTGSFCPGAPDVETTTDVQMVLAMAPGANIYIYYGSDDDKLSAMATDPERCHQLSSSWALSYDLNIQYSLLEMAAQGQTFFRASGDGGTVVSDSIISSPLVTDVAGTSLCMEGTGTARDTETALGINGSFIANGFDTDVCGDAQPSVTIPPYQVGIGATNVGWNSGVSDTYRNVADVSIVGDWVERVLNATPWGVGGTSVSSPLFAGFMALVNQQSLINGVGPVGFANPVLYAIGRTKGSRADVYRYAFNDITTGYSNLATNCSRDLNGNCSCDFAQAGGQYVPGYSAGNGYDLASGLGTPRFGLIQQLASSTPSPVLDVSAGMFLTCAVKSDHSVWCWGLNDQGQLGNGTITSGSLLPVKVTGISVAQSVSASEASACALLLDRSVQCWGSNDHGELGNGTTTGSSVPVPVSGITNATAVSAGGFGACALLSDGSVYCWGYNNDGQLGNGTTTDSSVPVAVSGLSAASGIAAGSSHSCAVLSDGTARCWGNNDTGQLGNGTTVNANVPTAVSGITNARQISAAAGYACAALGNGTIQCWGQNLDGTLGNGRTDDFVSVVPVNVANITTAVSVSSGTFNACALLSDGSVQCWGANESGELGNGLGGILSGYPSGVPVTASLTQPVVGISSGAWYSCARSNGAVSCWGSNFGGVLGDGSTVNRYVPGSVHFW